MNNKTTPSHDQGSRYLTIAHELRKSILNGKLTPGQKLPSERILCEEFKISRVTIRRALQNIEQERLIIRRHGSGTYVASQPERRIPLRFDYTSSVQDHAPNLTRRLLTHSIRPAASQESEILGIHPQEPILYAERLDSLKRIPVAFDQVFIPTPFSTNLKKEHLKQMDFVESWTKTCDFSIEKIHQTISAVQASTHLAKQLNVPKNTALLKAVETYTSKGRGIAGYFISIYNPEYICIDSHHQWTPVKTRRSE